MLLRTTGRSRDGTPSGRTPDDRGTTRPERHEGFHLQKIVCLCHLCSLSLVCLVLLILVLDPFIHVPQHVEQPKVIRSETPALQAWYLLLTVASIPVEQIEGETIIARRQRT